MDIFALMLMSAVVLACATYGLASIRIANEWERAVVLTLGKFSRVAGPGIYIVLPGINYAVVIDTRIITEDFNTEKTITKDTVPVTVNAVLFWKVTDVMKAAINVYDYEEAVLLASQTALRDIIGKTELSRILAGRSEIDVELKKIIDERISPWGVCATSVEIKDVIIPEQLQNAMSMQAQAERERQARIILGDSEIQVASKFKDAATIYDKSPAALHLRGMNMLFESIKSGKGTIILVPSSALDSMNLGSTIAMTTAVAKDQQ